MTDKFAKAEINIGALSFKGEGDQEWLSQQIEKLVEAATASGIAEHQSDVENPARPSPRRDFSTSLATYLKLKNAQNKQVERFLATAHWCHLGSRLITSS